jgi:hypothetical protein
MKTIYLKRKSSSAMDIIDSFTNQVIGQVVRMPLTDPLLCKKFELQLTSESPEVSEEEDYKTFPYYLLTPDGKNILAAEYFTLDDLLTDNFGEQYAFTLIEDPWLSNEKSLHLFLYSSTDGDDPSSYSISKSYFEAEACFNENLFNAKRNKLSKIIWMTHIVLESMPSSKVFQYWVKTWTAEDGIEDYSFGKISPLYRNQNELVSEHNFISNHIN